MTMGRHKDSGDYYEGNILKTDHATKTPQSFSRRGPYIYIAVLMQRMPLNNLPRTPLKHYIPTRPQ